MALSRFVFPTWRNLWDEDIFFQRPHSLFNQSFGSELLPSDILEPLTIPHTINSLYRRPWQTAVPRDVGSTITSDKDKFQVVLDVQQFKPEEITVKTINEDTIIIEGKHEEKPDEHGFISRHFVRKYKLPQGHDAKQLKSSLSSDGVLTLVAPKLAIEEKGGERVVPIQQTGPVRIVGAKSEENTVNVKVEHEPKEQYDNVK